jgi:hypothetical protein
MSKKIKNRKTVVLSLGGLLFLVAAYLTFLICFSLWPMGGREKIERPAAAVIGPAIHDESVAREVAPLPFTTREDVRRAKGEPDEIIPNLNGKEDWIYGNQVIGFDNDIMVAIGERQADGLIKYTWRLNR